jgi:hypothetical protein
VDATADGIPLVRVGVKRVGVEWVGVEVGIPLVRVGVERVGIEVGIPLVRVGIDAEDDGQERASIDQRAQQRCPRHP